MAATTTTTTSAVYIHVIEDVVSKVRDEFMKNGGPGESVLNELQGLWELKMMNCGAISGPIERSSLSKPAGGGPITPVHDLNVPYEGTEEYETPTAEILFPPTPLQTPIQTPLPGTVDHSIYNIPTGQSSEYPSAHDNDASGANDVKVGRPSPYMQPPSPWINQRPLGVDVNVAYVEGREEVERGTSHQPMTQDFFMMSSGKRKREDYAPHYHPGGYMPQQDGAGDMIFPTEATQGSNAKNEMVLAQFAKPSSSMSQQDGPIPDPYEDINVYSYQGVVNEDYNIVNTPATHDMQAGTPAVVTQNDAVDDDDEPPLNENDDDDLDDGDQGEEPNTQQLVLAQFDKVTRTKSRWKCTLKDGIMHINNKDILFAKATGEFDF